MKRALRDLSIWRILPRHDANWLENVSAKLSAQLARSKTFIVYFETAFRIQMLLKVRPFRCHGLDVRDS
jgi:adenosine/AMP kinase